MRNSSNTVPAAVGRSEDSPVATTAMDADASDRNTVGCGRHVVRATGSAAGVTPAGVPSSRTVHSVHGDMSPPPTPPPVTTVMRSIGNSAVGVACSVLCSSHGTRGAELNRNVPGLSGAPAAEDRCTSDHLEKHSLVRNGNLDSANRVGAGLRLS